MLPRHILHVSAPVHSFHSRVQASCFIIDSFYEFSREGGDLKITYTLSGGGGGRKGEGGGAGGISFKTVFPPF